MRITVYYRSGKVSEFNTETFTTAEPFRGEGRGGVNVATEFNLRLDRLEREGLVLEVFWHNALVDGYTASSAVEGTGRLMYHAGREPGRFVRLVSAAELRDIAKICVDGEMAVWRQGDDVINAVKFFNQELMCYSDESARSVNAKAASLFGYLRKAHPLATDEEVAQMIGFPYRALRSAMEAELAQAAPGPGEGEGACAPDPADAPNGAELLFAAAGLAGDESIR